MAELIMRKVLDRLGVVLLLKVRVIVVSAQQSGAVQFFLSNLAIQTLYKPNLADGTLSLVAIAPTRI